MQKKGVTDFGPGEGGGYDVCIGGVVGNWGKLYKNKALDFLVGMEVGLVF